MFGSARYRRKRRSIPEKRCGSVTPRSCSGCAQRSTLCNYAAQARMLSEGCQQGQCFRSGLTKACIQAILSLDVSSSLSQAPSVCFSTLRGREVAIALLAQSPMDGRSNCADMRVCVCKLSKYECDFMESCCVSMAKKISMMI